MVKSNIELVEIASNTVDICTTICCYDIMHGAQATNAHGKWMTSVSSMTAMIDHQQS